MEASYLQIVPIGSGGATVPSSLFTVYPIQIAGLTHFVFPRVVAPWSDAAAGGGMNYVVQ